MSSKESTISLLKRLWLHFNARRQRQFIFLLILILIASFAEVISIGAVLPFLAVLTSPERVFASPLAQPIINSIGVSDPAELLLPLTIAFGIAALTAGAMRILLVWVTTRLSFASGADLSIDIYRRTLYQPYATHCARNSSEIINGISGKANGVIYNIIMPTLILISSTVMLVAILVALLAVNPTIALLSFGGFGFIYVLIIQATRKQLLIDSQRIAKESSNVIKSLQEGLGGIRDVLIDGCQSVYCDVYRGADLPLRRAQGNNFFVSQSPRYATEALGMSLIALLAFSLANQSGGVAKAVPILGALALGAQRLLPVLQQAYSSWSNILSGHATLIDTLELLDQPLPSYVDKPEVVPLAFKESIKFNAVCFRYNSETPFILNKINLTISKGSRVGFIGTTGSGKSTLLDICMALLEPNDGILAVDGQAITPSNHRSWQAHIAHVPQAIFLSDSSIQENIAFGVPKDKINCQRVRLAAQQAQISDIIETWPKKYETLVGERGIRLSGGQRQRIGIARALYKQADVIVFDEATSALDNETEQAVMESIESLGKDLTILIIAHRLTTLKKCNQIVELSNGKIKRMGTYNEIMSLSE